MSKEDLQAAAERFGSGQRVRRIEDPALVTGRGRFADDVTRPGQLHIAFLRSPHAHAHLRSVDAGAARAMEGVVAVYTGADLVAAGVQPIPPRLPFKRPDGSPATTPPRRALAHERVRFVGEAVAAVVAETAAAAVAAVDAIAVDYEELPAVIDPLEAIAQGAPVLWNEAPDNIVAMGTHGDEAAAANAFAAAAHTVSLDLMNQRVVASPMEPRATSAWVDEESGRLIILMCTQMPTGIRDSLAAMIPGLSQDKVRVTVGDVGGGFGMKAGIHPEDVATAYAAWALKRPVKWRAQRLEEFLSAVHGRDLRSQAELALDAEGKVLALRVRQHANIGGYAANPSVMLHVWFGAWVSTSIYQIPLVDLQTYAVLTNTAPVASYRGAGRPEAVYVIERLFDAAARKMGLDPAELRRRNMVRPDQMPYATPTGMTYDVGEFERILDQGLALADWAGFEHRAQASAARGRLRGRGIATFLEWTGAGVFEESVTVTVKPEGIVELVSATMPMGQGIATSYAQLAVDVFDVPIEKFRIVQGDTDRANGFGSAGSRSLFTGGAAVRVASENTIQHATQLAAQAMEVPAADIQYRGGAFKVAGTDLQIGLFELAGRQANGHIVVDGVARAKAPSWPNACHVCEVEIDPESGEVAVVAYASVNDIGTVVNPMIARAQVEGGAAQGIGQALCEEVVYEKSSAQLQTASYMDYAMPRSDIFLDYKTEFDASIPTKTNVLGAKGVGELGTIGAIPAVVSSVLDALHRMGPGVQPEQLQMPLTAAKIWTFLQRAKAQQGGVVP